MKCKICGNEEFNCHQILHMDIVCDGNGTVLRPLKEPFMASCYESESPFGPFTCSKCGANYEELTDGAEVEDFDYICAPIKGHPTRLAVMTYLRVIDTGDDVIVSPTQTEAFDDAHCAPLHLKDLRAAAESGMLAENWLVADPSKFTIIKRKGE